LENYKTGTTPPGLPADAPKVSKRLFNALGETGIVYQGHYTLTFIQRYFYFVASLVSSRILPILSQAFYPCGLPDYLQPTMDFLQLVVQEWFGH